MLKKIIVVIMFNIILLTLVYFGWKVLFSIVPIVDNPENCTIVKLSYNSSFGNRVTKLKEELSLDEKEVLECLSKYKEEKTLKIYKGGYLGDSQFEIYIDTGDGLKIIKLGNENFSYYSYGDFKHQIVEAENLKKDLIKILEGGT